MFESWLQAIKNMGIASEKRLLYSNLLHDFLNLSKKLGISVANNSYFIDYQDWN